MTTDRIALPQLDDPLVWDMAAENHVPGEEWIVILDRGGTAVALTCRTCQQQWPCATRQAMAVMDQPSHFGRRP